MNQNLLQSHDDQQTTESGNAGKEPESMTCKTGGKAVVIHPLSPNAGLVVDCVEPFTMNGVPWWLVSWEEDGETLFNNYSADILRPVWVD